MSAHPAEDGKNLEALVDDYATDQETFKGVPWGKAMMWIFLLSDTFIFTIFLTSYMTVRMSTKDIWPPASEIFALTIGGQHVPLLLIAIMTFVLITSSGTMALAVNYGYRRDRNKTMWLMFATAALGAMFVGMQAFEWTKLIVEEGIRPWHNEFWRTAVWLGLFHDHRLSRFARNRRGYLSDYHSCARETRRLREKGQLPDCRNHGPVLAFCRSGLGVHLRIFLSLVGTYHVRRRSCTF